MTQPAMERRLRAYFWGGFRLEDQNGASLLPTSKKARCILAYCLFSESGRTSRETLTNLLWPDRQREQAFASLRQALHEIRVSLGDHADILLRAGRDEIAVDHDSLESDLFDPRAAIERNSDALLFGGLDFVSNEFDEWLRRERRGFVDSLLRGFEKRLAEAVIPSDEALDAAACIRALEPENELAARASIQSYIARGEASKAARIYRDLEEALAELGFGISERTQALMEQLAPGPETRPALPSVSSSGRTEPPKVSVGEVVTADEQPASAEFARRVGVQLQARLSEIREFSAVPNSENGPDATSSLADYAISGTVYAEDDKILGLFRIFRIQSGEQLWTVRTKCDIDARAPGARDAVEDIVSVTLSVIEQVESADLPAESTETWTAYQCYLKAKRLIATSTEINYMDLAQPLLERAVELNPSFSPPYSYLIGSYNSGRKITTPGTCRAQGVQDALALCQKFLVNDATSPNANLSMAWCLLRMKKFDDAAQYLERAVEYGLYDPNRLNAVGTAFVYLGDADRGLEFYDIAKRRMIHNLDFLSTDYGEAHYFKRDFDKAFSYLDIEELRNPVRSRFLKCATFGQMGRLVQARSSAEEALAVFKDRWTGDEPFSPKRAVSWYLAGFPLRRTEDRENLVQGLAKAGFVL